MQKKNKTTARETAEQRKNTTAKETAEQRKKQRDARAARVRRRTESRKAKRRQPYSDSTCLVDLVRPEHYLRLRQLMKELQPFLADGAKTARTPCLTFDLAKLEGQRQTVYNALAVFLFGDKDKRVLKVPLAAFARYLTDPRHSNFTSKHNTLMDKLQKARKLLDLT